MNPAQLTFFVFMGLGPVALVIYLVYIQVMWRRTTKRLYESFLRAGGMQS